jgi:hypothetical protein
MIENKKCITFVIGIMLSGLFIHQIFTPAINHFFGMLSKSAFKV